MDGRADSSGRVYQSSGDQHITEHHHHGGTAPAPWTTIESVRRPTSGREPTVLRDRVEVVARLKAALAPGTGGQTYVLHGMGGSGKTALARVLFRYATEEAGRTGLWVNAADPASLRAGMLAVAADRGAAEDALNAARNGLRAPADLVWDHLDTSGEPWLLVLDNADTPEILEAGGWLRTSPRGTVLVTTRRATARWWPGSELLHLDVLPREAAAQVLCDLAPDAGTLEEAAQIADRLGRLPLALTLAGSFLSHQVIDPWSMTAYSRQLDGGGSAALLDQGAALLPEEGGRVLVTRTWQLSLDSLAAQGVAEAGPLLRLLACFSSDPLPLTLLKEPRIDTVVPRARAEVALRGLLDRSLTAVVDVGVRCVQTHAVLLAGVHADTPPDEASRLTGVAAGLLDAAVPAIPQRGPRDLRMNLLAPHALALLRLASDASTTARALDVAVRLACALHRTGDYLSAWELAAAAADVAEPKLGPEHRLVLSAYARVGRALFRLGRFEESESVLRRVLTERERLFGPGDPDTLDSCFGINHALQQLGRTAEGIELLRRATEGRRRVLGENHALTLQSRAHLLEFLPTAELAAEVDGAVPPLPEQCAVHLGPDHAVTLGSRLSHAFALVRLGRFAEAAEHTPEIAADYQRVHGPAYALTLSAQFTHAHVLRRTGRPDQAAELMAVVARRRKESLGPGHPYTAPAEAFLAECRAEAASLASGEDLS